MRIGYKKLQEESVVREAGVHEILAGSVACLGDQSEA